MELGTLAREPAISAAPGDGTGTADGNNTLAETARCFVQALVSADSALLERISRSVAMGYPAGYVVREFRGLYAEYDLADLQFVVDPAGNRVSVCHGGERVGADLRFKQLGAQYFFTHFDR